MGTSTNKHRITNFSSAKHSRAISRYLNNFNLTMLTNDTTQGFLTRENNNNIQIVQNSTNNFISHVARAGAASFGSWAVDNDVYIVNNVVNELLNLTNERWQELENADERRNFCKNLVSNVFPELPHVEDQDMLLYSLDQALDEMISHRQEDESSPEIMIHSLVEAVLHARLNLIIENYIEDKVSISDDIMNHDFISTLRRIIKDVSQECNVIVPIDTKDFTGTIRQLWQEIIGLIQGS